MKLSPLHGLASAILAVSVASAVFAQADMTPKQKAGYSVGANIGGGLSQQGLKEEIDVPSLVQGLQDAISSGKMKLSTDDMKKSIEGLQASMQARMQAQQVQAEKASKDFLAKNAKEPGVKTTASGLQYSVVSKSKDPKAVKPKASDTVKVHYEGKLVDGSVFDSSIARKEPITVPLSGVIPGWTEGVQLMSVGDKFRFVIPAELGYGTTAAGPIPPNATLVFEVELLGIEPPAAAPAPASAADGAAKKK